MPLWDGSGRSIQSWLGVNPVHQMTFATSRTLPSSRTGYPFLTPVIRGTRSMPAAAKSLRRTRPRGMPARRVEKVVADLSSDERVHRQHPRRHEPHEGREHPIETTPGRPGGLLPRVRAGQPRPVVWSEFDGDLRAGVPAPTTNTPPSWIWDGLRSSLEWSWTMRSSSSRAHFGILGLLEAPVATTTFSASSVSLPQITWNRSPTFDSLSTLTPVRTGSSNARAYASR